MARQLCFMVDNFRVSEYGLCITLCAYVPGTQA